MPLGLRVVPSAEREIRDATAWWQVNRPAAKNLLHDELARGFELITNHPSIGAQAIDTQLGGVRRLLLYRISYHLYYRVDQDFVEVLAFWHTSLGQGPSL
ncbi:MAG: hypothetical protein CMJ45_06385 [Planctomyces sp.]|nr:hypothetical protein [Planctomyces sp.]